MAHERGIGHVLQRRVGGGTKRTRYGGSQYLTHAAMRNQHLARQLELTKQDTDYRLGESLKSGFDSIITLSKDLERMRRDQCLLKYLDGDLRGKRPHQCDANIKMKECLSKDGEEVLMSYLPYLSNRSLSMKQTDPEILNSRKYLESHSNASSKDPEDLYNLTDEEMVSYGDSLLEFNRMDLSTKGPVMEVYWSPKTDKDLGADSGCSGIISKWQGKQEAMKMKQLRGSDVMCSLPNMDLSCKAHKQCSLKTMEEMVALWESRKAKYLEMVSKDPWMDVREQKAVQGATE